jgi:hypothetical protein
MDRSPTLLLLIGYDDDDDDGSVGTRLPAMPASPLSKLCCWSLLLLLFSRAVANVLALVGPLVHRVNPLIRRSAELLLFITPPSADVVVVTLPPAPAAAGDGRPRRFSENTFHCVRFFSIVHVAYVKIQMSNYSSSAVRRLLAYYRHPSDETTYSILYNPFFLFFFRTSSLCATSTSTIVHDEPISLASYCTGLAKYALIITRRK